MKEKFLVAPVALLLLSCDSTPKNPPASGAGDSKSSASTAPPTTARPDLVGNAWVLEDIETKGVIDNAKTSIRFDSATKVSGHGGVNRFSGPCTLDGAKLTFGPLVSTRMAGPPAVTQQEQTFLAALEKVRSFKQDENGLLYFENAEGAAILRLIRDDTP